MVKGNLLHGCINEEKWRIDCDEERACLATDHDQLLVLVLQLTLLVFIELCLYKIVLAAKF